MNTILNWLVNHFLLFSSMLMFAAADVALGGGVVDGAGHGNDDGGADGGDSTATTDGTAETSGDAGDDEGLIGDQHDHARADQQQAEKEEPEVSEFKGAVSARLRALTKQAPELTQVFQKYPKLQEQIEATFRREAALRDVFPTVAEARQMREHFPNGLADVQQLQQEVAEVEELDQHFYNRDQEGNYTGHPTLLNNMFNDDREATVALFRTLPKEWARLDRDSYNEVMGSIVGATLQGAGILDYLADLTEAARGSENKELESGLKKLTAWANGYAQGKSRPTPEEERIARERADWNREKQGRAREDGQRFHGSFLTESRKLQLGIITNHPAMKRLEKVSSITPEKRGKIAEEIRSRMEKLLGKSRSFMGKLRPAYDGRNLEETMNLQRAAWSQPWLLNKMVREVLRVETPQMVETNRASAQRRAGAPQKPANKAGEKIAPTGPVKIGGRWYRDGGRGAPFTTQEVLAGKHLS